MTALERIRIEWRNSRSLNNEKTIFVGDSSIRRPGNIFSVAITKITGTSPCNRCAERIAQMNQWGWLKCWRNRKTIAGWLAEEARARGHVIDQSRARDFLKAAFKELCNQRTPNAVKATQYDKA